jgi:hypothetical protein
MNFYNYVHELSIQPQKRLTDVLPQRDHMIDLVHDFLDPKWCLHDTDHTLTHPLTVLRKQQRITTRTLSDTLII